MDSQGCIYLSLGSNLGDCRGHLLAGLRGLDAAGVRPVACSPLYRAEPVGGPPQDDFLNLVLGVETALEPRALLQVAQQVEHHRGPRSREERWGPRSLDIDLLLYGNLTVDEPGVQVPHPRFPQRRFVLVPLAHLAPDQVHPISGVSVAELLARCEDRSLVEWHGSPLPLPPGGRVESPPAFG